MLLEIIKETNIYDRTSKLGKKSKCTKTRTVYKIECDICKRVLHRAKGETRKLEQGQKHACSPECSARIGAAKQKEKHIPRLARHKSGYLYLGKERVHRVEAAKKVGRNLAPGEIVHHIDGDKGNNQHNNLYVCKSIKEHNRIHGQLEGLAMLLVQQGKIIFNFNNAMYELSDI